MLAVLVASAFLATARVPACSCHRRRSPLPWLPQPKPPPPPQHPRISAVMVWRLLPDLLHSCCRCWLTLTPITSPAAILLTWRTMSLFGQALHHHQWSCRPNSSKYCGTCSCPSTMPRQCLQDRQITSSNHSKQATESMPVSLFAITHLHKLELCGAAHLMLAAPPIGSDAGWAKHFESNKMRAGTGADRCAKALVEWQPSLWK